MRRRPDPEHPAYDPSATTVDGFGQCRRCLAALPAGQRDFCSNACRHEFRMRASAHYARSAVYARDKGICFHCRWACGRLDRVLQCLATREPDGPGIALDILEQLGLGKRTRLLSTWQADHRHAVAEGGADCGLGNYRTLCLRCHAAVTRELHQRLRDPDANRPALFHE